ncbi:MAG TPA: ABC transporter permease, partial [Terriglobales bacterium]|nr:ABC transporter permease [Terriglobales bacterium]
QEIESYIAHEIDDNVARGMSRVEAERHAYLKFGNPQRVLEHHWQWNTLNAVDNLARDFRHAARTLLRDPGFTLVVMLVMAVGIGANTAMFTVVRSVLLKPLPFPEPGRLVMLYERTTGGRYPFQFNVVAGGVFQRWNTDAPGFEQMAAHGTAGYNLSGASGQLPEKIEGTKCSWNLFSTLGVRPAYGRVFVASEDTPSANAVVVLSWSLWKRRFGGDPSIVGRGIVLDNQPWTVIGIMPPWFSYPDPETQVCTPLRHETTPTAMASLNNHQFRVVARLRPGITPEQGLTQLITIQKRLNLEHPNTFALSDSANLRLLLDEIVVDYKTPLYMLLAATACFLLIACLNLANLFVARCAAHRKELAIRSALGGSRWRLIGEQMAESVVLAVCGGTIGVSIAYLALRWIVKSREDIPRVDAIHMDTGILWFAVAITLFSGTATGLLPIAGATGSRLLKALQEASRSHGAQSRDKLRKALLSAEVGLTMLLLISAGLLLKSYQRLRSMDLGCAKQNILTMRVTLPKPRYADAVKRAAFFEQMIARVRDLPGVQAAGLGTLAPGQGYWSDESFMIVEHPPLPPGEALLAIKRATDPGYFAAMGIPLLRGRTFYDSERLERATSVMISELLAKQFFPNEDPIGKHMRVNLTDHSIDYEVVGIVGDTRHFLTQDVQPTMYFPLFSGIFGRATIALRSTEDPTSLALPVQKLIAQIDPDLPVSDVLTMEQIIGNQTLNAGFDADLVLAFAGLSLLLAAIGLYGVLSYVVTQRTGEIGVRVALGAQRAQVLRLMLFDGLRPAAIGLAIGLAAGIGASRLIRNLLYGVKPLDLGVYLIVGMLLLLTAGVACMQPAWRASRLNPMDALRSE